MASISFAVDMLVKPVVVPKHYAVKYAIRFVDMYTPDGENPPPAVTPGKLSSKDSQFLTKVAWLPYKDLVTLNNLLQLKNDKQKLADLLDNMYDEFISED